MKAKTTILGYLTLTFGGLLLLPKAILNGTLEVAIGQMKCGNRYLQPVNGVVGDVSCGFNMDMAVGTTAIVLLLVGLALIVSTKVRAKALKG